MVLGKSGIYGNDHNDDVYYRLYSLAGYKDGDDEISIYEVFGGFNFRICLVFFFSPDFYYFAKVNWVHATLNLCS